MKQRILVVHDDHVVADTLKLIFELNGYDSEAVYTPAQGIDNARTFAPNLILFDASIPVEAGLQLVKAVQIELPCCRMMVLTPLEGNAPKLDRYLALTQQPPTFLRKPCRPETLLFEAHNLLHSA
jgi:DNA-binding response OmpR family regulator